MTRRAATVLLLATLVGVAACSDDDGGSSAATSTTTTTAPEPVATASSRCEASGSPRPAEPTTETVDFDGTTREYRLATPDDFTPAPPLVLNFHGFSSNADQQAIYSRLETEGPARGFVVATPQGTGDPAFWNILRRDLIDDVAYAQALIDDIGDAACIDTSRVYATGISNGAGFSAMLACEIPDEISAIAPVAGINLVPPCPDGPPVSVIAFHGDDDRVVPYEGGSPAVGAPDLEMGSVPDAVAAWAERDGCDGDPTEDELADDVRLAEYTGCVDGTEVELYTVLGGGHTWPGAIDVPRLGPVTTSIDATDLVLEFFSAH